MKTAIAALALSLVACTSSTYGDRKLPAPAHLPQTARELLAERMLTHGNDMTDLLWATLFLDDESVKDIAHHIERSPRLSRPLSQDASELNSSLPAEFFDLQDELVRRAAALAEVASSRDPEAMAAAYGALTQTCVRCHSLYLSDPPTPVTSADSFLEDPVTGE